MEEFLFKSGSAYIFIIHKQNSKIIKKTIYRKKEDKFNKEIKALTLLNKYQHFPKIIKTDENNHSIYMTYCGDRITKNNIPDNWKIQVRDIIKFINETSIVHGDINPRNICIYKNIIYLIDFGNIRFYKDDFFILKDFTKYREKQHRKLYNICNAVSRRENPWKII
jgi:tRNA A-37 threonylcarbamoyl transferase component Bud32